VVDMPTMVLCPSSWHAADRAPKHYGMISELGDVWFRQGRMSGRCVPRRPRPRKNGQPRAADNQFAFAA
jgi:hypothetical protein